MPLVDLSLAQLEAYRPDRHEPADFAGFWDRTLAETRSRPLDPEFTPVDTPIRLIDIFDVTFSGYSGDRIKAWLALPAGADRPLPCVVEFPGYGGGRGLAHNMLGYAAAGFAHLLLDVRGQGSGWSPGDTPDHEPDGGNPQFPGMMTRGVLDKDTYYYRRVVSDAVRLVETARAHPLVDASKVAVTGISQGGGLALITGGLVPDVAAVLTDVPFLCHYRRAVDVSPSHPYQEIERYLKCHRDRADQVFGTLEYFDAVHHAAHAQAPAMFSVAILDDVCPPSTVYAAFHHYAGPKRIVVYGYNGHEGGESFQHRERLNYLHTLFA